MTISSSLNASVSGLNANASRLATISDNIANASTYGYKRAQTDFHSMVTNGGSASVYSAGGVRTTSLRLIGERGALVSTSNPTDIAIDGRGFFPVTTIAAAVGSGQDYPVSLATTGSFRPDADGILRTTTGEVLLGWPASADGSIPDYPRDSMSALTPVRVNYNQYIGNPTTSITLGVNLPATSTIAGATAGPIDVLLDYYGNLSTPQSLTFSFSPIVPMAGASNQWVLTVADSASGGAQIGEYVLAFDDSQNAGGTLAGVTTVSGGTYDPATGTLPLTVGGGEISLLLGKPGEGEVMTQLSGSYAPVSISKNGSPVASLSSVEIDETGKVYGIYDQGFSRLIYQIPVVDVPNPNALITLPNQTYQMTPAAGFFYLWDAGSGPTGSIASNSREESMTDITGELTQLIQTQRAYSSNAKVIQTVDEMMQETANLKR